MIKLINLLKENQEEIINQILDKIIQNGYNSLNDKEKNFLSKGYGEDPYQEETINIENALQYFTNIEIDEKFLDNLEQYIESIPNLYGRNFLTKSEFKELYFILTDLEGGSGDYFDEDWEEWKN